jgi:hypothetical protein
MSQAHAATTRSGSQCPAPESLVPGTTWHKHVISPGVTLTEGQKTDSKGLVKMHVLRINVLQRGLTFGPLVHSLAQRTVLSKLAANKPHLVAATNTGYFDFYTGAPTDPLISHGFPSVISAHKQQVVGLANNGYAQNGHVWLVGTITAGTRKHAIHGVNELHESTGLEVFNKAWGSTRLPGVAGNGGPGWGYHTSSLNAREVISGKVQAAQRGQDTVPSGGYMLVGRNSVAASWLRAIPTGTKISMSWHVATDAPRPFKQAYGVGAEYVQHPGVVRTDLSCNSANTTQPARTSIGFANGGKTLVIGEVEDHPGTNLHGLDESQMSKFMVQLGVSRAFAWDGSGSTELLARMSGSLKRRTYPADGTERPMPLGFGVYYTPPKKR